MTGAAGHLDKELVVLRRSVRMINDELLEIESDQKHLSKLLEDLGLTQSNIVKGYRVQSRQKQSRTVQFQNESKRQRFGAEPCDLRTWHKNVWTSLKQSSVLHERCRNRQQVT